jgi:tight adherence protein C
MTWILLISGAAILAVALTQASEHSRLTSRLAVQLTYRVNSEPWAMRVWRKFRSEVKRATTSTKAASLDELVEFADVLVLVERLLIAGDSVSGSIAWLSSRVGATARKEHGLLSQFGVVATRVAAGASLNSELMAWQEHTRTPQLREMIAKFVATNRQGVDLVAVIRGLQGTVDSAIRAKQLANFSNSETKMLVPLVFLVLPITVLFAVFPSLTLLNLEFIN